MGRRRAPQDQGRAQAVERLWTMDLVTGFEAERARLERIAAGLLGDRHEAQDVVQEAWLRLDRTDAQIDSLPAWLTTVTTRLCLDRLRARVPEPVDTTDTTAREAQTNREDDADADPAKHVALADTVGVALQVVLEQLTPTERVAFVLHDTFGVAFATVAEVLDVSPVAARKSASRARAKVVRLAPDGPPADWEVVDAFLAAARGGDFARLLHLLAPDVVVTADPEALATGTPRRIEGRAAVAEFFDGAAASAFPAIVDGHPGAAWFHRGTARVAFDFRVETGQVVSITFRAAPETLEGVVRRTGADPRPGRGGDHRSHPRPATRHTGMSTPTRKDTQMKTMTCRDLGGPCDLAHSGTSADEVIQAQDQHLKEMVSAGDTAHQEAADAMSSRWQDPAAGMGWYEDTKQAFADLSDD